MKKATFYSFLVAITCIILLISCSVNEQNNDSSRTRPLDEGWRFIKDNPNGAENPEFDDLQWRIVDIPHDWSIEDLPDQKEDSVRGPFSKSSPGKMMTGFTVGGTGWYRKSFTINPNDVNKIIYLQFDGIYMNADVWVNGKHLGYHPNGYTSFYYNITSYLNPAGQPNVVAVQVKNEGLNARWYSGSGIYRHTWLTLVKPVHIAPWGVYITTPEVTEEQANVEVVTNVTNTDSKNLPVTYMVRLFDPTGTEVEKSSMESSIPAGKSVELRQVIQVENPALWSVENPNLYHAQVELLVDNKIEDNVTTAFGIRTIHFDAQTGFTLNGKKIKLKGGCFHHDNGPLGAAAIDRAEERKIEILKNAGFNAIRCSHNPPSPYLLDVCDRLGMLVIDEAFDIWEKSKFSEEDHHVFFKEWWKKDLQSMILRDWNHPSVIMWSIGNEIPEVADTSGFILAQNLVAEVRRLDTTRSITEAVVDMAGFMGGQSKWDDMAPHFALLDVAGYNYGYNKYENDHIKYPNRVMYSSESMIPQTLENWQLVEKHNYVIGNFSWTAIDYIGEAGIGLSRLASGTASTKEKGQDLNLEVLMSFFNPESWPIFNAYCGSIDLIGNRKPVSYYQDVVWRKSKIEMLVHRPIPEGEMEITTPWGFPDELKCWSWPGHEGEKLKVQVYTRSSLVKLELNGKVIGEQTIDEEKSITATFEVPYEPGTLIARCYDNGQETASDTLVTVGKPVAIRLIADRETIKANRNDLSYVSTEIIDANGNVVPYADDVVINYEISGNGEIAGVGNGNPSDMSSFQQPRKTTYQGKCLAIVRPKGKAGKIILKAKAEGLQESAITIVTQK